MAGERAAGGWEILAEGGSTVARASEVADQVPLALAWPFKVGGTRRGGEALRVGFPGGRDGLSKGQDVRNLQQRAGVLGVGGKGTAMHALLKVSPHFLRMKTRNPRSLWVRAGGVGAGT